VDAYREAVSNYRNVSDKTKKREIERLIADIKGKFTTDLQTNDPNLERLKRASDELRTIEGQAGMFEDEDKKATRKRTTDLKACITKLEGIIEDLKSSAIYQNAFEWRLEFPEVLDSKGGFIGFDVIIGNPPYGANLSPKIKTKLLENYTNQDYQLDTYMIFMELAHRIMRVKGEFGYIVPNTWLSNLKCRKIRQFFLNKMYIHEIAYYKKAVFDEATVDTLCVLTQKNNEPNDAIKILVFDSLTNLEIHESIQNDWKKLDGETINVLQKHDALLMQGKLQENTKKLNEIAKISIGMKPYQVGKGKPRQTRTTVDNRIFDSTIRTNSNFQPLLRGSDIKKYATVWDGKRWINYGLHLAEPRASANFHAAEKLVVRQTGDTLIATLDTKKFICMNNLHVITAMDGSGVSLKYLLALLNSKLCDYYHNLLNPEKGEALAEVKKENLARLPIKLPSVAAQKIFVAKVQTILKAKTANKDTTALEREIDDMVYKLYGLSYDEVKTIEPDYSSMKRAAYEAYVLPTV
jgi:hypothetical protein